MNLKVKTRNDEKAKFPPPHRQVRMICVIHCCQVAEHLESIEVSQHILPYDEPDLYNDYISKEPDYMDFFCINFLRHCVLGHILLDSNLLDDLGSWKEVVQPTKKPRSVGLHKLKPKKTTSKKENMPEEQEIQESDYTNTWED